MSLCECTTWPLTEVESGKLSLIHSTNFYGAPTVCQALLVSGEPSSERSRQSPSPQGALILVSRGREPRNKWIHMIISSVTSAMVKNEAGQGDGQTGVACYFRELGQARA